MKKRLLLLSILFSINIYVNAHAATLMQVYQQALISDAVFQQAIAQHLSTKEGVPISWSNLLPNASVQFTPLIAKTHTTGSAVPFNTTGTVHTYNLNLTITQTIFNFGQWANLFGAKALSKEADATLNAAAQNLMLRVAKTYFAVLNDKDNLRYALAAKKAYAKQLEQVTQQYKVGLKTITDVYTAQASYENSVAELIAATNSLEDAKENLRVITGILYPNLALLSEKFPLISPSPSNMTAWVETAERQNWSIKAAQYAAGAAKQNIKQQYAGHLPTLQAQAGYDITSECLPGQAGTVCFSSTGVGTRTTATTGSLILNIPLVQGGLVVANTHKAQYDYQVSASRLDQEIRNTINTTRQSYLGILSSISKITADRKTIQSSMSALNGMEAAYEVGTQTLVDVLDQRQKLFQAQKQYASDKYAYINNFLSLKAAAGTLSQQDLIAIDKWLLDDTEALIAV